MTTRLMHLRQVGRKERRSSGDSSASDGTKELFFHFFSIRLSAASRESIIASSLFVPLVNKKTHLRSSDGVAHGLHDVVGGRHFERERLVEEDYAKELGSFSFLSFSFFSQLEKAERGEKKERVTTFFFFSLALPHLTLHIRWLAALPVRVSETTSLLSISLDVDLLNTSQRCEEACASRLLGGSSSSSSSSG